ncbi:hypothetical protein HOF40_04970 [Candidatus Parcubacteria bacterium]|jgi:hypothetical protein|nr:hypothetical protein [Candidatus Parcubacteria bacterium]MBT3949408.1 hypothetical protein [Candidatus Parcubacteria bacterium]
MGAGNPLNFGNTSNMRPGQGASSSVGRAQNFSTTTLQQKKDRAMASTSIGRVIRKESGSSATTSIGRVGGENKKSTSVFHDGSEARSVYDDDQADEVRDRLRYQHIRQVIKDRKASEAAAAVDNQVSKYNVGVKTGGAFKTKGRGNFSKKLKNLRRKSPASFKSLSNKDIEYFTNVVSPHAKGVKSGTGISRSVRTGMKRQLERDRRSGKISSTDSGSFKKMVDNLPH